MILFLLQGSDVLYGFRKACRIWTDMHQSSTNATPLSAPGPSSTLSSVPSGQYDKIESLPDPPKIVVSYDNVYCEEEPKQESTNLTKLCDVLRNLKSHASATHSGECTPSRLSEKSSSEDLAELKPLLQNVESQTTNKSRSSQFATPQPSQTSTDSKIAEFQPLLLFGQDSSVTPPTSFCLGSELSSSAESRNLSLRRVSFAPSVVTSEITVPKTEKDDKSMGSKFLSNIHSLKSMVVGNPKNFPLSGSPQYPRLFPDEYLPSSPSDSSAVPLKSTTVASQTSRCQTPPPNDPPVCNDLIDLSMECSLLTATNESGCTLKSDATNQSLPRTPSHESIQRMEGSFSSPALLTQAEKDLKSRIESNKISSSSTITEQESSSSTVYESTTMSSTSSSSSSLASSPCSSILSFVQSSPPSSVRELIGLNPSDNSSLNHSKHTLLTASSCDTQSEWTSLYDISPPFSQNVLQMINFESSISTNAKSSTENKSLQQSCSLTQEDFSLAGPSGVQNESTLAKLFQDYATDSSVSSPSISQSEIISTLQNEPPSKSELDLSDSSVTTLVRLFEELASQTSRVSSQFSELGKIMSSDSNFDSETTLAKLFKQSSSQTTNPLGSQFSSDPISSQSMSADSNLDSEATLAKLFKQSSSQATTAISSQISTDLSIQTSTDVSSQTSSKLFPSALSLSTERASHDLTTSTSSGSTLPNDIFGDDSTYSLNATTSTSEPTISTEYSSNASNMSSQRSESTACKWSATQLPEVLDSCQSSSSTEKFLPDALLALTQPSLGTSFTVSESKVIDIPSLMETLKQVTSLLATSHAILNLTLSTLKAKLAAQPPGVCVCTCQPYQTENTLTTSTQVEASISQSEPVLRTQLL